MVDSNVTTRFSKKNNDKEKKSVIVFNFSLLKNSSAVEKRNTPQSTYLINFLIE